MFSLNNALGWLKTLKERHAELVALRNENSKKSTRWVTESDKVYNEPIYSVRHLDKLISSIAKEIRLCDEAIKNTNAVTEVVGYSKNEDVLGELEEASK